MAAGASAGTFTAKPVVAPPLRTGLAWSGELVVDIVDIHRHPPINLPVRRVPLLDMSFKYSVPTTQRIKIILEDSYDFGAGEYTDIARCKVASRNSR
ncbi:hypothetical protein [Nocardia nova]|uniref:hypothetical protein n=1 Tax=Nocardia nova TaxID=37330 RepID=UPI0011DD2544|nr:hypothetical protein [Nocardia nova]